MVIIMGKTSCGKDTVVNELISKHGLRKLVTYSTRPMRDGEKQDITYHFITEDDFKQKIRENFFAEYKSYDTEFGIWYYGVALEDVENADDKTVIILTPDGYRDVIKKVKNKPKSIYIYANNSTIKERLINRGDESKEEQRRLEQDNIDFKGVETEDDKIV